MTHLTSTTDWTYEGELFNGTQAIEDGYVGFVYLITDLSNGIKYVGKKTLISKRRLPPLKGKKRKRVVIKESDWPTYYGSSEEVKGILEERGAENFKREVLHLCKSKGEMSYLEVVEQIERKVLLTDDYYNGVISCKIHKTHVKNLK